MHLALNKATGDLYKPEGGGVTRVDQGRFVVQQVQCKLRTIFREWILDRTVGFVGMDDFKRNYSIFELEDRAKKIILGTQGVEEIITFTSDYSQRILTLTFSARTIYGVINLTIPWDNANVSI